MQPFKRVPGKLRAKGECKHLKSRRVCRERLCKAGRGPGPEYYYLRGLVRRWRRESAFLMPCASICQFPFHNRINRSRGAVFARWMSGGNGKQVAVERMGVWVGCVCGGGGSLRSLGLEMEAGYTSASSEAPLTLKIFMKQL